MASLPAIPCPVSYHLSFLIVYKNDGIEGRRACCPALQTAVRARRALEEVARHRLRSSMLLGRACDQIDAEGCEPC